MRIGAHVSTSGGAQTAIGRALEIGANCIQIFAGPPQRWASAGFKDDDVGAFRALSQQHDVLPSFIHSSYLINLATCDPVLREKSLGSLLSGMEWAGRLGAAGVITHMGSSKDGDPLQAIDLVAESVAIVLDRAPKGPLLLLETCAGQGNTIGRKFEDIAAVIDRCGRSERLGVCLDTAHVYEAGYDIATESGLEETLQSFDSTIGLARLAAVHVNDSKTALGSNVDRHENIGFGTLGEESLARVLRHPSLRDLPFLLEVPGMTNEGPDRPNIEALRRLAGVADA